MNVAGKFPRYTPTSENDAGAETLSLLQARDFLVRQWRFITLVTGLVAIAGLAYLAITPARYTAQADMIIDTKRVSWSQSEMATENRSVEDPAVESEIETTKSEKVALNVIRRLRLNEDPEFIGAGQGLKQRILALFKLDSGPVVERCPECLGLFARRSQIAGMAAFHERMPLEVEPIVWVSLLSRFWHAFVK